MDMKKNKTLLRLALCLGLAVGAMALSPAAYADSYKYSRVRSAVNDGDRYVTQAKSARNDAERYQRDAERYQRDAASYTRQKKYDLARDYQRKAGNYLEKARDAVRRAERADSYAADAYRRAAAIVESR